MNGLSLFAGIAGLDLGIHQIYPQSRTICFVERDIYSSSVLRSHILKGTLPMASIYSYVTTFAQHCHLFDDKVDYITAGFPCQPFSKASSGRRKGINDERWLWSSIIDIIRSTSPSFLFLENVSNLLNEHEAFSQILSTLASCGFDAQWVTLQASEVGANHQRNRLFIFAYRSEHLHLLPDPNCFRYNRRSSQTRPKSKEGSKIERRDTAATLLFNPYNQRRNEPNLSPISNQTGNTHRTNYETNRSDWWQRETPPFSPICRMDDGIRHGMDRLRALGNAVVPYQANVAFTYLINQAKGLNL